MTTQGLSFHILCTDSGNEGGYIRHWLDALPDMTPSSSHHLPAGRLRPAESWKQLTKGLWSGAEQLRLRCEKD